LPEGGTDYIYLTEIGRLRIVHFGDIGGDPWREPKALDRCDSCLACLRRCPTGAIYLQVLQGEGILSKRARHARNRV
jgi:ferredoxin